VVRIDRDNLFGIASDNAQRSHATILRKSLTGCVMRSGRVVKRRCACLDRARRKCGPAAALRRRRVVRMLHDRV
jgi:hypothetical protein